MIPEWLTQPVPFWAFVIALLTRPAEWSGWVRRIASEKLGTELDDPDDSA